ncbi:hypothetical protein [Burkholderia ubonensis]|uniref:hypothetical protein n=1 Tax=Burkholderia ubonensis TaxID=101571 RepID=UPI000759719D|nr:hypothetical protein [Burkholderia ubonensis]KVC77252.1 nitroreductase [Burkholderia ubonensis]KWF20170.1 nitroreductase [Burkholderia ubonensis]
MDRSDKSAKARAALDQLFSGVPPGDANRASRSGSPFDAPDDGADVDPGVRGRVEVALSTRIQLRGYPNADAFMKRMAEAWGLEWGAYDSVQAVARLPAGWRFRQLPGVMQIVDRHDVLRAESSLQGGEMSYLKVHPRYYIDARKGFAWGRSSMAADDPELDGPDWHCFVVDREKSGEVHEMTSSSLKADLDRARTTLLKWLDENYPDHRDPFAYWTDCEPAS